MPKYSISVSDEVARLIEFESKPDEPFSQTIARLIRAGSKYEVVTTIEVREKDNNGTDS